MNAIKSQIILILTIIVLNIWKTNALFGSPKNCGKNVLMDKNVHQFIVGGTDAKSKEFPFMVAIYQKIKSNNENKYHKLCGASIISNRWVLTAAHCLTTNNINDIILVIGIVDITEVEVQNVYLIDKWIINGCYNKNGLLGDIALIRTKKDIVFDENVNAICLPPKNSEPIGTDIQVIGWGVLSQTNQYDREDVPIVLQKSETKVVSEFWCNVLLNFRTIGFAFIKSDGKLLCLRSNTTSCRGDSGGPAFQTVNGKMYQLGVVSFGAADDPLITSIPLIPWIPWITTKATCYKTNPTYFTKVSKYMDWIQESIQLYEYSKENIIHTNC